MKQDDIELLKRMTSSLQAKGRGAGVKVVGCAVEKQDDIKLVGDDIELLKRMTSMLQANLEKIIGRGAGVKVVGCAVENGIETVVELDKSRKTPIEKEIKSIDNIKGLEDNTSEK